MKKIIEKPWDYILKSDGNKYVLEVICGSVGIYTKEYELSKDDIAQYEVKGEGYISSLARRIQCK